VAEVSLLNATKRFGDVAAVDDVFVVPVPSTLKVVGFFRAAGNSAIAADARDDVSIPALMYNIMLSCSFRMFERFYGVCNTSCVAIFVAGLLSVSQLRIRKCGYGFVVVRWLLLPSHLISLR